MVAERATGIGKTRGQIPQATRGTDRELIDAGVLAQAVSWVDPVEGEQQLRGVLAAAGAQEGYARRAGCCAGSCKASMEGSCSTAPAPPAPRL